MEKFRKHGCRGTAVTLYNLNDERRRRRRRRVGVWWSLPAGGAPLGAAQTCPWPESGMIVLLQRERRQTFIRHLHRFLRIMIREEVLRSLVTLTTHTNFIIKY